MLVIFVDLNYLTGNGAVAPPSHSVLFLLFLEVAKLSNSKSTSSSSSLLLCKKGLTLVSPGGVGVTTKDAGKDGDGIEGVGPKGVIVDGGETSAGASAAKEDEEDGETAAIGEVIDEEDCFLEGGALRRNGGVFCF